MPAEAAKLAVNVGYVTRHDCHAVTMRQPLPLTTLLAAAALANVDSAAASLRLPARMPSFSWETLPVGWHSSNASGLWTPAQTKTLSRCAYCAAAGAQAIISRCLRFPEAVHYAERLLCD